MPSINGGSQFDDDYVPQSWGVSNTPKENVMFAPDANDLKNAAGCAKPHDFDNVDVRLFLALKKLYNESVSLWSSGDAGKPTSELESIHHEAATVLGDFEASFGPLPDWAVGRNFGYELIQGAQLCTKDGRRTGNAHIVSIEVKEYKHLSDRNNPYGEVTVYNCLTDAGSRFTFTAEEVESAFTIGDWLSSPDRIIADFDRNGEFKS